MKKSKDKTRKRLSKAKKKFIISAVKTRGRQWKSITKDYNQKYPRSKLSAGHMSSIYETALDPIHKKSGWTEDEEILLVKSVSEEFAKGMKTVKLFSQLKKKRFPARGRNDLKNNYYRLFKEYLLKYAEKPESSGEDEYEELMFVHIREIVDLYIRDKLQSHSHIHSLLQKVDIGSKVGGNCEGVEGLESGDKDEDLDERGKREKSEEQGELIPSVRKGDREAVNLSTISTVTYVPCINYYMYAQQPYGYPGIFSYPQPITSINYLQ